MKTFLNTLVAFFSPLAAVPTGWAIYAGVTKTPVFPMNPLAAGIGAVAIILVDIAAAMLVTDTLAFNATLRNQTERKLSISSARSWAILGTAILAEIVLSLVIVVFERALAFGVLVFPIMTGAGVFAFAARMDLQARASTRDDLRSKSKRTPRKKSDSAMDSDGSASDSAKVQMDSDGSASDKSKSAIAYPRRCEHCDANVPDIIALLKAPQSKGGHMKKHHPDLTVRKAYSVPELQKAEQP